MANILRLAAAALAAVPTPKDGVTANQYGAALKDWHRAHATHVYLHAANLAISVLMLTEAEDSESVKFLDHLERQAALRAPKLPTDSIKGESREQKNDRQKLLMRERRAAAKAAKESA